ncbi:hypothetical protein GobsT_53050 [Gemmata obscuriglobus]|uniref:Uncharacterized protein n=1 Tax=Gemmata obscuriglobus TaxID=114 RepID=A0A2Z3GW72_9BACT|nr:hypothetical protein [Gemmata obscuriglobus]AWM36831.1 hypothetical protein C1280_07240 [Gemmata obscuriglobus]QEG30500.1 hypothetical protein GobsT_53050 [Gemmata obscuriglobus]VTS09824.1 unnamed protein product [Gemmata obscuriglobus UQM 2246]
MVRYSLCVVVTALSLTPASAETILGAADILDSIPPSVPLADARAIALVPAAHGATPRGLLFVKGESGWGEPEFVVLRDAPPTGTRETPDYVLIFRTRRGVERVANGDGRLDPEVTAYAGRGSAFAPVSLGGAVLRKGGPFAGTPDRKRTVELKAKLTELATPKAVPEVKVPIEIDWVRIVEQREVFMGGFAALGAWLAMMKRRKR